ncbi:MAG: sensor histidine kinase [Gemmatimonas sp.]
MPALAFADALIATTRRWGHLKRYAAATALVATAGILRAVFDPLLDGYNYFLFECAVALAALFLNHASSLVATALSVLVIVFLFTDPPFSLVENREDLGALGIFVLVCLLIGVAGESLRKLADRLDEQRAEKETLYRELSHRTANNLQIIGATIAMEATRTTNPETRERLRSIADRIGGITRVDRLLALREPQGEIDAGDYLQHLCNSIGTTLIGQRPITIVAEAEPVLVSHDLAETLGIAANELVTNSVKHAFPHGAPGTITVRLNRTGDGLRLVVEDDGRGCATDARSGTGWKLITSLIGKYKGTLTNEGASPGCRMTLTIPQLPKPRRT